MRELVGGKNTIGPTAAVLKKPHKATYNHLTTFVTENLKQSSPVGRTGNMCEEHKWGFMKYGLGIWAEFVWHRKLHQDGALGDTERKFRFC